MENEKQKEVVALHDAHAALSTMAELLQERSVELVVTSMQYKSISCCTFPECSSKHHCPCGFCSSNEDTGLEVQHQST